MGYAVRYRCPHCAAILSIERTGYLADRSVTPYPLEGWTYVSPTADYGTEAAEGIRFVCGEYDLLEEGTGCGEPWYLSFVRYEDGERIDVAPASEFVEIRTEALGPGWPGGPTL